MSATVQQVTGYDGDTSASSHTFAHNSSGGGSNLAIVVGCGTYTSGGRNVTGITYDGEALTEIRTLNAGDEGADLYARADINTGAALNVVITLNGSANIGAFALTAHTVDQTTPVGDSDQITAGANPAVTLDSENGDLAVDIWEKWASSGTVNAGQTQIYQGTTSDTAVGASYKPATGATVSMGWSGVGSAFAYVALVLKQAATSEEYSGTALLSGSGLLITLTKKGASANSLVENSGGIASVVAKGAESVVALSGSGSLSTIGTVLESLSGSTEIGGSGLVTAVGRKGASVPGSLPGSGLVTAVGQKAASVDSYLSGSGSLNTVGVTSESRTGSAALSGSGSLVSAGRKSVLGVALSNGKGEVVTQGSKAAGSGNEIETGLEFPRNDEVADGQTVRFKFTNPHSNGLPIYGASGAGVTYIWRLKPEQQTGYYTTMFWANDDDQGVIDTFLWDGGGANTYYGAHPYPRGGASGTVHDWEISADAVDTVNGLVVKDQWYTQAFRAWGAVDANKDHEFYWDLPNVDSGHKVTHQSPTWSSNTNPPFPALTFGDAPWQPGKEMLSGVLRGLQIYSTLLTEQEILDEIAEPLSTVNGAANIWYLNLNPTPTDISDKSGNGNDPAWVGGLRPALYSTPAPLEVGLRGSGSLTATGTAVESYTGSTEITGSGSLSAVGQKQSSDIASLTGSGSLSAVGQKQSSDIASLTGSESLSAVGQKQSSDIASLTGSGSLATTATTGEAHSGSAVILGSGLVTAAGAKNSVSTITVDGFGSLEGFGLKKIGGEVSLSGGGYVSLAALKKVSGSIEIDGSGDVMVVGGLIIPEEGYILRATNQRLYMPAVRNELLKIPHATKETIIA